MVYNRLGRSLLNLITKRDDSVNSEEKVFGTGVQIVIDGDMVFTIANFVNDSDEEMQKLAKVIYCMYGSVLFPSAFSATMDRLKSTGKPETAEVFQKKLSELMDSAQENESGDDENFQASEEPFINPQLAI